MPRMPQAEWVGEHGSSKMSRHDIVCAHTIVGYAPAHAAHFSVSIDGHIFQSRDTVYKSAANLDGNHRVIAIETADMPPSWNTGNGHDVPDFSDGQCDAIADILRWCRDTHDIPITPCPNSLPTSRGVAYHRQGIDGNFGSYAYSGRVSGGELWSSAFGKVCPGDRKIKTLLERIIPAAAGDTTEPILTRRRRQTVDILRDPNTGYLTMFIIGQDSRIYWGGADSSDELKRAHFNVIEPEGKGVALSACWDGDDIVLIVEGQPLEGEQHVWISTFKASQQLWTGFERNVNGILLPIP